MVELETIAKWLRAEYNEALSVYTYNDYVRITNGSAAHYIDIYPNGGYFALEGENYGETITDSCEATKSELLNRLSQKL